MKPTHFMPEVIGEDKKALTEKKVLQCLTSLLGIRASAYLVSF